MSGVDRLSMRVGLPLLMLAMMLTSSACHCGEPSDPIADAPEPAVEQPARKPIQAGPPAHARERMVVTDAAQLADLDLGPVEELDLSLSEIDTHERPGSEFGEPASGSGETGGSEPDPNASDGAELADPADSDSASATAALANPRCTGLDLHDVATRAPRLESVRISGCQAAVHAGLSAFGEQLRTLELVDLELDAVTVARLSQLHGLERLILTRVHAEPDALKPLGRKISPEAVVLRELRKDSPVAELFGILHDIREIEIVGPWVTHNTMIQVGKAKRLERLAVLDTDIGNYSLHQIKPLDKLHRLEWSGSGFNDTSAVFMKELPIDELICDCPRFGDRGLHQLYLFEGLRVLDLERSAVSSAGLVELQSLHLLEDLTLRYVDMDADGFAALAGLPMLRRLALGPGTLLDPKATGLGALTGLQELIVDLDGFGDAAAPELTSLVGLEHLDLGHTAISDEGLAQLAPLTRLVRLELQHTRVTKHGLAHLAGMHALEILELDHTDVVDEGVAHLTALVSLRDLRLDHTLITDAAVPHIAKLVALERLNLADTVVTRQGIAGLEVLEHLSAVNLAGTRAAE